MAENKAGNNQVGQKWRNRIIDVGEIDPEQILANPLNFRIHPKNQQDALLGVLDEVGWVQDVIVNARTNTLIDGHLRVKLALRRGEKTVPAKFVDLSPEEEALILSTFDPISALAATDKEKLDELLQNVDTTNEELTQFLSDFAEDNNLYFGDQPEELEDPGASIDKAEELREKWGVESGQLWQLGNHRVICGDCTDAAVVDRLMDKEKVDCLFTSPPYGVGVDYGIYEDNIDNLRELIPAVVRIANKYIIRGGYCVLNFGDIITGRTVTNGKYPEEYPMALEYYGPFSAGGFRLWSRRIWVKPHARVAAPWTASSSRAASDFEHIWTFVNSDDQITGRTAGEYNSYLGWVDTSKLDGVDVGKETHGAGMPVSLAVWMINIHTLHGGGVVEPFIGTGTTLIACEKLSRKCYGVEIEPKYVAVTLERWHEMTGKMPELVNA